MKVRMGGGARTVRLSASRSSPACTSVPGGATAALAQSTAHRVLRRQVAGHRHPGHLLREIVGNAFGLGSALSACGATVWAWPVGIIGNVLLFTVFLGQALGNDQGTPLYGQASRQVFFIIVSVYGWWLWRQKATRPGGARSSPRWATSGRAGLLHPCCAGWRWCSASRLPGDRRGLPGAVVVLPGRLLDLRRLDPGDVRDGPRLGGLLALLDRGGPGRGAGAAALRLLPFGDALRLLCGLCDLGFHGLAAIFRLSRFSRVDSPAMETVG